MKIGSVVRTKGLRPKYNGLLGTIVEIRRTKVVIFIENMGRVVVPMSSIELAVS